MFNFEAYISCRMDSQPTFVVIPCNEDNQQVNAFQHERDGIMNDFYTATVTSDSQWKKFISKKYGTLVNREGIEVKESDLGEKFVIIEERAREIHSVWRLVRSITGLMTIGITGGLVLTQKDARLSIGNLIFSSKRNLQILIPAHQAFNRASTFNRLPPSAF